MTAFKRVDTTNARQLRPGDYFLSTHPDTWVIYKCPKCGFVTSLSRKYHNINYNGDVSPSVRCPHKLGGGSKCEFKGTVELEGWIPKSEGNA